MDNEANLKKVSLIFLLLPPPRKFRWAGFFLILLILCTASCNTTEPSDPPVPPEPILKLELEDVSCTEAWINLTTKDLILPAELTLKQYNQTGDSISKVLLLNTQDTLLYIDSLLPNTSYQYQASRIQHPVSSNELSVTTMDTTSHNLTWQTWTFGEHSNSVLFDVAILGNEIWAVGEIYMKDSLGNPDNNAYNAIHWDGSEWELKRLNMLSSCNPITYPPLRAIWAFSENNIVVTSGGSIGWFYGITNIPDCTIRPLLTGSINKLWSSSSNDLYAVGNAGNIAHWNGSNWTKIESGTDVDLLDVGGSPDGTVWACGYNSEDAFTSLLRYDGTQWNKVYEGSPNNQNNNEYIGPIAGVWTNSKFFTYVTNWAFIYTQPNNNTLDIKRITPWFSDVAFSMRGTDHNNIFVAGQDGLVGHYNGVTYTEFIELKENGKNYFGAAVKNNIAVAVGVKYGGLSASAVMSIGRR